VGGQCPPAPPVSTPLVLSVFELTTKCSCSFAFINQAILYSLSRSGDLCTFARNCSIEALKYRKVKIRSSRLIEARKYFLVGLSKYRGSIYDLSMFIHYPNYTHRIPNVSPGLFGRIFGEVYRGPIFGELVFGGLVFEILRYGIEICQC